MIPNKPLFLGWLTDYIQSIQSMAHSAFLCIMIPAHSINQVSPLNYGKHISKITFIINMGCHAKALQIFNKYNINRSMGQQSILHSEPTQLIAFSAEYPTLGTHPTHSILSRVSYTQNPSNS